MKVIDLKSDGTNGVHCRKGIPITIHGCPLYLEICIYMVMYGWRVRVGRSMKEDKYIYTYDHDICAGNIRDNIVLIYDTTLSLIAQNYDYIAENKGLLPSGVIPEFEVKPVMKSSFYNDFIARGAKIDSPSPLTISDTDLLEWRIKLMGDNK